MRSGVLSPNNGKFWTAGLEGHWWSSYGTDIRHDDAVVLSGYYMSFNSMGVNPSRGPDYRFYAFPLRCLSTVLGM